MRLTLDHVILRAAEPAATLAELAERTGDPVLEPVHTAGSFTWGTLRASVDIRVLAVAGGPTHKVLFYGFGSTADVPIRQASAELRALRHWTSIVTPSTVGLRTRAELQVGVVMQDPLSVRMTRSCGSARRTRRWSWSPSTASTPRRGARRPERDRRCSPSRSPRRATTRPSSRSPRGRCGCSRLHLHG